MSWILAVDIGGTFTDLIAFDVNRQAVIFRKALTNYGDLVEGVLDCVRDAALSLGQVRLIKHGTTQVINAFIQRHGARTALITTRGFRDVLEIGRAGRAIPFRLVFRKQPPLVPRPLIFELGGRLDGQGREIEPLDTDELERVAELLARQGVEAVAVSFVNAYRDPGHEQTAAALLRRRLPNVYVTTGTELSREWYEYERTSTAVANAYVGPRMKGYVERFEHGLAQAGFNGSFCMMASNGGVLSVERTLAQPVAMVESGPIGGCIGAGAFASELGLPRVIAFDMGGTTAKCALVEDGRFEVQQTYYVGGYEAGFPIRTAVLDIVEVGAGGGSIASIDTQGRLHVGPRSAGAEPGPVAFGRGGCEPTVTDANLFLGRIGSGTFLGGALKLDVAAARQALFDRVARPLGYGEDELDRAAHGVLALATTAMAAAIKEVTIERGRDLREFELFAFGGGGPLFASALARELHISSVIVPPEPGNFSAMGMLLADPRIDETQTFLADLTFDAVAALERQFADLEDTAAATLRHDFGAERIAFERQIEMRYKGQKHSIRMQVGERPSPAAIRERFNVAYERRYGHVDPESAVELVGLQLTASAVRERLDIARMHRVAGKPPPVPKQRDVYFAEVGGRLATAVYERAALPQGFEARGPAIIEEYGSTIVIGPHDRFSVGCLGEIRICCDGAKG